LRRPLELGLYRLARPRRKPGLYDPGIDPSIVQLRDRLLYDLEAMRDDQNAPAIRGGLGRDRR